MEKCPNCGEKYIKYPLFNDKKKPIIENWLCPDWQTLLLFLSIFAMLYGFLDTNMKCENAIKDPYTFCKDAGVLMPFYDSTTGINLPRIKYHQSFGNFAQFKIYALASMVLFAILILVKTGFAIYRNKDKLNEFGNNVDDEEY
jgi:hypothetical protein